MDDVEYHTIQVLVAHTPAQRAAWGGSWDDVTDEAAALLGGLAELGATVESRHDVGAPSEVGHKQAENARLAYREHTGQKDSQPGNQGRAV